MKDIVATVLDESLIKKGWVAARLEVEGEGRRDPGGRVGRTREKAEGEGGGGGTQNMLGYTSHAAMGYDG